VRASCSYVSDLQCFYMGRDGIEPSTSGLKVRCSTD
jgi:hypothetical protein